MRQHIKKRKFKDSLIQNRQPSEDKEGTLIDSNDNRNGSYTDPSVQSLPPSNHGKRARVHDVKNVPNHQKSDLLSYLPLIEEDLSILRKRSDEFDITMTGSEIIDRVNHSDSSDYLWNLTFLPGNRAPDPPKPPPLLLSENSGRNNNSFAYFQLFPKTPRVYIDSQKDAHSLELRQFCLSQPVAIIRNLALILNLDLGLFSTKMLIEANPTHKIEQRIQEMQAPDENKDVTGKTILRCHSSKSVTTIQDYANYQARTFIEGRQEEILENTSSVTCVLSRSNSQQSKENGVNNISSNDEKKNDCRKRKVYFGTNCDLSNQTKWSAQLQELNKLPDFLKVTSPSNLLCHCGFTIMGMNSVQLYMKVPGCRTPGHQENNNFCSININIGPGDCEWFSVTEQYWGAINTLCEEHKVDYLSGSWWPNLDDLKQRQIPVYRFVQRPGDLVWINAGTVHWVQAIGWCNNVAWNVGPVISQQYSVAMERYEYNKTKMYKSIVPMVHLSWQLGENVKIYDSHLFQLIKYTLMTSIIHSCLTWNFLERAHVSSVYQPREANEPTQYCEDCECEVFNIFLIKPIRNSVSNKKSTRHATYETRCLNCALKISVNLSSFKCLYQYTLAELGNIYDSFQLNS